MLKYIQSNQVKLKLQSNWAVFTKTNHSGILGIHGPSWPHRLKCQILRNTFKDREIKVDPQGHPILFLNLGKSVGCNSKMWTL